MKFRKSGNSMSCWDRSLGILSRRDHSEQELRSKLKERDYSPEQINETIQSLIERKFLDDERYFESRVRNLVLKHYGRRRIQSDLTRRGLKWDERRFEQILRELDPHYVQNSMKELLDRKTRSPSFQKKLQEAKSDRRMVSRLQSLCTQHLVMKGFSIAEAGEFARSYVQKLTVKKLTVK